MMNYIWVGMIVISVIAGISNGRIQEVQEALFSSAEMAVDIVIGLVGVMVFFTGLMEVMEKAGLCEKIGKAIGPIMGKLFPEVPKDHPAMSSMALYIAANFLGIGNAATPFGLKAMADLQRLNKSKRVATDAQCMLLTLATTSVTVIPVTVLAIRSSLQVEGATEVVGPIIFTTLISTLAGVLTALAFQRNSKHRSNGK